MAKDMFAEGLTVGMMLGSVKSGGGGSSVTVTYPSKSEFSEVSGYPCNYLITETYNEGTDSEYKKYIGIALSANSSSYHIIYYVSQLYIYNDGFDPSTDSPTNSSNYKYIYFNNFYIG